MPPLFLQCRGSQGGTTIPRRALRQPQRARLAGDNRNTQPKRERAGWSSRPPPTIDEGLPAIQQWGQLVNGFLMGRLGCESSSTTGMRTHAGVQLSGSRGSVYGAARGLMPRSRSALRPETGLTPGGSTPHPAPRRPARARLSSGLQSLGNAAETVSEYVPDLAGRSPT